jgi:biopolymer transport protein ExbD
MSVAFKRGNAEVRANLTPMIDVTFLLIVFFVLVSEIVEAENVDMNLPEPIQPLTEPAGDEQRVVINIVPDLRGGAREYRVGARRFATDAEGREAMIEHLRQRYEANPALAVSLRADQQTHYQWVQPAMQAVVDAAGRVESVAVSPQLNLVVINDIER